MPCRGERYESNVCGDLILGVLMGFLVRQGSISWWPKWPTLLPLILASKGLFDLKLFVPPGSPSMPQGGLCLGSPGAESLRTSGTPLCAADMPTRSIFHGALCGPHLPQAGFLMATGHACACPLLGPLVAATQGSSSPLMVAVAAFFVAPALACVHLWTGPLAVVAAAP